MKKNLSFNGKRAIAGMCAVMIVGGAVPVQPISNAFTSWTALTASATVATEGTTVSTLDDLIDAVKENGKGGLIKLGSNISSSKHITVNSACTIDLNGHDLTCNFLFINKNVTIKDSAGEGTLTVTDSGYGIGFYGSASLTIESGNLVFTDSASTGINPSIGPVTINGGTITSQGVCSIYNVGGNITINGGTITSQGAYSIYNESSSNTTINGGTIIGGVYGSDGNMTITGGRFSVDVTNYVAPGSTVTKDGDFWVVKQGLHTFVAGGDYNLDYYDIETAGYDHIPYISKVETLIEISTENTWGMIQISKGEKLTKDWFGQGEYSAVGNRGIYKFSWTPETATAYEDNEARFAQIMLGAGETEAGKEIGKLLAYRVTYSDGTEEFVAGSWAYPEVFIPNDLTAYYGQTLADVALPTADNGTWAWKDSTASVGDIGTNSFNAVFTPTDTSLNSVTRRIDVEVLHPHDFTYTAGEGEDANKITAVCNGEGDCGIEEGLTMIITASNAVYDGKAHTATLNDYNTTAFPGPYTIEYYSGKTKLNGAPVNVGEYTAKITVGEATASVDFAITIADTMTSAPTANDLTYNSKAQLLVKAGSVNAGKMLYALSDSKDKAPDDKAFSESIPTGTDAGTYYVWYKASGDKNHNGTGAEVVEAKIKTMSIKGAEVVVRNKTYTGKALKPGSKIIVNGKRLKKGVDFTITFKNNAKVGRATAVITGIGNYKDSVSEKFNIRPKKTSVDASSAKTGKLTVKWKKTPQATGYQIKVTTSKKFTKKSTVKNVFAKKSGFVTKTFTKLKSGKTYYVKVRAYKKVGNTKIYGQYSAVKTVTVK